MEQNSSLFNLSIDPVTKEHLSETAKWARFLAIVGLVLLALMVGFGIYFSTVVASSATSQFEDDFGTGRSNPFAAMGVGMAIVYVILALIWFFPLLFLLRFSNKMRSALAGNDQNLLNNAFQNLKASMRYVGIVTIIILVIYALVFVIAIATAATMS